MGTRKLIELENPIVVYKRKRVLGVYFSIGSISRKLGLAPSLISIHIQNGTETPSGYRFEVESREILSAI